MPGVSGTVQAAWPSLEVVRLAGHVVHSEELAAHINKRATIRVSHWTKAPACCTAVQEVLCHICKQLADSHAQREKAS